MILLVSHFLIPLYCDRKHPDLQFLTFGRWIQVEIWHWCLSNKAWTFSQLLCDFSSPSMASAKIYSLIRILACFTHECKCSLNFPFYCTHVNIPQECSKSIETEIADQSIGVLCDIGVSLDFETTIIVKSW